MFIVPLSQLPSIVTPIQTAVKEEKPATTSFGDILREKIQGVKDLEAQSLQSAYDISVGNSNDIEGAMLDATKASTAIEMTVQLTTRVVNAYKDIMSMQV